MSQLNGIVLKGIYAHASWAMSLGFMHQGRVSFDKDLMSQTPPVRNVHMDVKGRREAAGAGSRVI